MERMPPHRLTCVQDATDEIAVSLRHVAATIKLSDKADALIAQLQKEIFNRRRKKVSAAGVVETLVNGAKSQSDKRFAALTNLIKDIEKAAKLAYAHGSKPSTLTGEEGAGAQPQERSSAS